MEELGSTLSELEKQLATTHDLVNIRGKQGRKVPVLIPPLCQRVLGVITDEENRKFVGILPENPYVFSISGKTTSHLRTYDCINTVAQDCGAKCPELIKSTKMRKYTATVSQILDLQNNEVEWLANHLGHSIKVHRDFYSFKDSTTELTKVAKLLVCIDQGTVGQWAGKTLKEIQLDDIRIDTNTNESDDEELIEDDDQNSTDSGEELMEAHNHHSDKRLNDCGATQRVTGKYTHKLWSMAENKLIYDHFSKFIKQEKVPGQKECVMCLKAGGKLFNERSWRNIKYKVKNIIASNRHKKKKDKK